MNLINILCGLFGLFCFIMAILLRKKYNNLSIILASISGFLFAILFLLLNVK